MPQCRDLDPEELGEKRLRQTEELASRTDLVWRIVSGLEVESELPNGVPLLWGLAGRRELGHLAEPVEDLRGTESWSVRCRVAGLVPLALRIPPWGLVVFGLLIGSSFL